MNKNVFGYYYNVYINKSSNLIFLHLFLIYNSFEKNFNFTIG